VGCTAMLHITRFTVGPSVRETSDHFLRGSVQNVKMVKKTLGWPTIYSTFVRIDGFEIGGLFPRRNVGEARRPDLTTFNQKC